LSAHSVQADRDSDDEEHGRQPSCGEQERAPVRASFHDALAVHGREAGIGNREREVRFVGFDVARRAWLRLEDLHGRSIALLMRRTLAHMVEHSDRQAGCQCRPRGQIGAACPYLPAEHAQRSLACGERTADV